MGGIWSIFENPNENCEINSNAAWSDSGGRWETHDFVWYADAILAFIATVLSAYLIYRHCTNYTCPKQQKFIIRLLLMVPIYALDSFASFRLYYVSPYFDVARNCYEAFVIQNFFSLLIEYAGGYHKIKESLMSKDEIRLVFPLMCIKFAPRRGVLRTLYRCTLQYVVIMPLVSIAALILQPFGLYCDGNWSPIRGYFYITAILFVSVTIAMYGLVLFYTLTAKDMEEHKPLWKFAAVKAVIFLSFWQSIIIAVLVYVKAFDETDNWTYANISDGIQNTIICVEMVIAAIAHIYVFSYKEYIVKGVTTPLFSSVGHAFNPVDIWRELKYSFSPKSRKLSKNSRIAGGGNAELTIVKDGADEYTVTSEKAQTEVV